jgi:glycosyltransferase involved in cell wall biosynthesis
MPIFATDITVTAIIPACNEEGNIVAVVEALLRQTSATGVRLIDEVIVADNASTDRTAVLALAAGATVVFVPIAGYGRACWEASQVSHGDVLLFVDGDGAANPADAGAILDMIHAGADLVIGERTHPDPQSMSATQRFGNAFACALIRLLWGAPVRDLGPYRAIRRVAFDAIDMRDRSFGWTVEMQVRAHVLRMHVAQVNVAWHARVSGESKISGTLRGVVGAGVGILGMVCRLWLQERKRRRAQPIAFKVAAASDAFINKA